MAGTMKRKLETSIKQFPRLFGGKRASSEREDDPPPRSMAASPGPTPAPSVQNNAARTSLFAGRAKSTGKTPAVDINTVVSPSIKTTDNSIPIKDPSIVSPSTASTATAPAPRSSVKLDPSVQSISSPVPGQFSSLPKPPPPPEVPLPSGSVDSLDDFSLRRLLDKRLFISETAGTDVVLAIRLSVSASVTVQIASSLSRVLTKDEKKKKEILLVFTRAPEFRIHGVTTSSNNALSVSWSFSLQSLLAVRETKRGVVVLQFAGGKERRIVPVSEAEKGWLFYGVTRLSREHVGTDPTIIAFSSIRLIASEESLNSRCPFLTSDAPPVQPKTVGVSRIDNAATRKTDISFTYEFGNFNGGDEEDDEGHDGGNIASALARQKRASLIVTDEESKIMNKAFVPRGAADTPDDMIRRSRAQIAQLGKETVTELRAWESGQGPVIAKKSVTDVDTGRRGDPIASLLAHLEDVELNLRDLDDWMNAHDSSVLGMTTIARRIDTEIKNLREEGVAKERLASHLKELLEDLSPEDDQILSEMSALLPIIQRELESYQVQHPIAVKMVRALKQLVAFRDRGGGDSRISARRDRFKRMKERSTTAANKLSEFLQGRIDYYYKYERGDVREAHGRLVTYAELVRCLKALSPPHFNQVNARYQAESCIFLKTELTKLMDAYFTSPIPSSADSLSKYADATIESTEALRFEQEVAIKEVHMAGVESRRRFVLKLRAFIKEEDAFCLAMGTGLEFAPGLVLAMDGLWQTLGPRAQSCPVSFAAPLLNDMERLTGQLQKEEKFLYSSAIKERFVLRLAESLDRFLVDQVGAYFDKAKRSNPVFVKKLPGLIDRLSAAGKGFGDGDDEEPKVALNGCISVTKTVLQNIATQPSPFHRLENLFYLLTALQLRMSRGDSSNMIEMIITNVEAKHEEAMKDVVGALLDSAPGYGSVVRIVKASEDDEDFTLSKMELDETLSQLQNGGAERTGLQIRSSIDAKLTTHVKLRNQVLEATRDTIIDSYWRLAELAAETFGITVVPSASSIKDIWFA